MNTKEQFKKLTTELLLNNYLVSKEKEEVFCNSNKLKLQRLLNGAILLGTYLGRTDSRYATINFGYSRGTLDDPVGKSGLAHLYEHCVFTPEIMNLHNNFSVGVNGRTAQLNIDFKLDGDYNSNFSDFGIKGALEKFVQGILNPKFDETSFNNIKSTIASEYKLEQQNFDYQSTKALKKIIFDEENYANCDIELDPSILKNISIKDVQDLLKLLGGKNLIVSFLYDGEKQEFLKLFDEIQQVLLKAESKGEPSKYYIDPIYFDGQNEKTFLQKNPQTYKENFAFENGKVVITKFLSLPLKYCSCAESQTTLFFNYVKDSLFLFLREKGFSYRVSGTNYKGYGNYIIPVISTFEQKENYEKQNSLFSELLIDAFKFVLKNEKTFKDNLDAEKTRQKASFILQENILDNAVEGLVDFNFSRDTQFIRNAKMATTCEMGMEFIKSLSKAPLHTFIYGEGVC